VRAEDGGGVRAAPIRLVATVRIDQGRVNIDLTECAPRLQPPTNATFAQTYSGAVYVLKCLIDPDISVNDGFYRLVDIRLVAFGGA
jgi:N-methylhydantoinase B